MNTPRHPDRFRGRFQSSLPGLAWPAILDGHGALLAMLLGQLDDSQWLAPTDIEARQLAQLQVLLRHVRQHSGFYAECLADVPADATQSLRECLDRLPIMLRSDLQSRRAEIDCTWYPAEHGEITIGKSTGSTGEPVVVKRTALNGLIWMAMTLREHLWQRRDFDAKLAVIRANLADSPDMRDGVSATNWGTPVNHLFSSGPLFGLSLQTDVARQVTWLSHIEPDYLLTYPSNLSALLDAAETDPIARAGLSRLRQARTIGETIPDVLREKCRKVLGVGIADIYSSQEVGVIALQCPEGSGYHSMAEGVIVEILDDDNRPCAPGCVGRVVVTDLHNFATPIIRYDLGDLAEAGTTCGCGRGLPRMERILGRHRNLVRLPDGRRFWPLVGAYGYRSIAPVRQYQVLQRSLEHVTLRLSVERPLSSIEEAGLARLVCESLGHSFGVDFEYFPDGIPRGPGGKFEDFVCQIPETIRP